MFGFKSYNYEKFTRDQMVKDVMTDKWGGPKPGDRAPDFEGRTLDGDKIRLKDYRGEKNVVLTFGSATCPFTAASIHDLNELYDDYNGDDVQFLFVYVREAHPGEKLPAHHTMQDKVHAAELFRDEEHVEMPVIADEVDGDIHKGYGKLPNSTYIIDKSGRVAYRCLWTQTDDVEEALRELLDRQEERGVEHAVVHSGENTHMPSLYAMLHSYRALERGGRKSMHEFREEMGMPGRMALAGSRVARPIAMNPGKALLGAALTAGVITGALYAGRALRNRRLRARMPYYYRGMDKGLPRSTAGGEYEAVGI